MAAAIDRLGAVQLDSISTVERSHRLALTSRVGAYPRGTVSDLLGDGRVIETWVHEACLVPATGLAVVAAADGASGGCTTGSGR